jgi:hypothetical protein
MLVPFTIHWVAFVRLSDKVQNIIGVNIFFFSFLTLSVLSLLFHFAGHNILQLSKPVLGVKSTTPYSHELESLLSENQKLEGLLASIKKFYTL